MSFELRAGGAQVVGPRPQLRHPDHRPHDLAAARRGGVRGRRRAGARPRVEQRDLRRTARAIQDGVPADRERRSPSARWPSRSNRWRRPAPRRPRRPSQRHPRPRRSCASCRCAATRRPRRSSGDPVAARRRDKNREKLATLLEVSKGLGTRGRHRRPSRPDRAVRIPDPGCRPRGHPAARRRRRARPQDLARQARRRRAARRTAVHRPRTAVDDKVAILSDNAGEDARFGGQSILHAAGALGDLRAAHRQRGQGARRALRGQRVDHAPVRRRGPRLPDRVRRHRRRGHREQPVRRAHPARDAGAQQLRAVLHAATGQADRRRRPRPSRLGGDKRTVAVLFSDIRGFTALSETMNPDDMAQPADRVLHRDGGLRVPARRHAGQVHRRRRDGAVGRADRRPATTPTGPCAPPSR